MAALPPIFHRYTNELWYIFHVPFFFFVFMVVWLPFRSETDLDMGRSLFVFNVTMMMCVIILTLLLTRTLRYLLRQYLNGNWWQMLAWCVMELTLITYFLALYLYLMDPSVPYFRWLARCLQYSFLVLVFPYLAVTGVCALVAAHQSPARERELVRFLDSSRQVRLVLLKDVVLYIKAQENYVRIYYLDNGNLKDYTIRSTMRAIEPLMERFGFIRSHRSYYVNPSHIVAVRRDRDDVFSIELDVPDTSLPISKRVYQELAQRL